MFKELVALESYQLFVLEAGQQFSLRYPCHDVTANVTY